MDAKDSLAPDEIMFFDGKSGALALYGHLRHAILIQIGARRIEVFKTQISFKNRHLFAAVSLLPVRPAKDRPPAYITLTFGLRRHCESPRIDAATEARPGRWTHHVMIGGAAEIDPELMAWVAESAFLAG